MTFLKASKSYSYYLTLTLLALIWSAPGSAQDYEEWSAETRTSLGFRVNAEVVRSLLPDGWSVAPSSEAADQVSLTVTFMDRHIILDPQGQVVGNGTSRYMVMSVQARNEQDETGILILNGISPEGAGAYEVYQLAETAIAERSVSGQGEDNGHVEERWVMEAQSGDSATLTLHYQQATPTRRQSSIVIRSGKNTDYTRTYRIDQASDALGSPGAPDTRIQAFSFTTEGPLYSRLFEGSVLTGVTSTSWYNREISIP